MFVVVRATTMPGASGRPVGNSASGELLVSRAAQAVRPVAWSRDVRRQPRRAARGVRPRRRLHARSVERPSRAPPAMERVARSRSTTQGLDGRPPRALGDPGRSTQCYAIWVTVARKTLF